MSHVVSRKDLKEAADVFRALAACLKDLLLYGEGHPRYKDATVRAARTLQDFSSRRPSLDGVTFLFAGAKVHLGKLPVVYEGVTGRWLAALFLESGIEGISLRADVTAREIAAFSKQLLALFHKSRADRESDCGAGLEDRILLLSHDDVEQLLRDRRHEELLGFAEAPAAIDLPKLEISRNTCYSLLTNYRSLLKAAEEGREVDYAAILKTAGKLVDALNAGGPEALPPLDLSYFDEFTFHHSVNVCCIATAVASTLTNDQELLSRIAVAALLHDIGKCRVPAEILNKPGRLTRAELEIMRIHPVAGASILIEFEDVDPLAVAVAFGHHLSDGPDRYPTTLRPFERGWVTRLISVADVYEALTAVRPYKPGLSSHLALEIMLSMPGLKREGPLIKKLFDVLGPYPVGTLVELTAGQRALVLRRNATRPLYPLVRVLTDVDGTPLEDPYELDLAEVSLTGGVPVRIRRALPPARPGEDPLTDLSRDEIATVLDPLCFDDAELMRREG